MKMNWLFAIVPMLVLAGCLNLTPEQHNAPPTINNPPAAPAIDDKLAGQTEAIGRKIADSQNAIQQNTQAAVGLSVGKVADDLLKLDTNFHHLVDMQNTLNTSLASGNNVKASLQAALASNNELRLMLKMSMNMNVKMQAQVMASAKLSAEAQISAGVGNKTSSVHEDSQVGGNMVQFNDAMRASLEKANQTTVDTVRSFAYILVSIVTAMCGAATTIVTVIMKGSRDRALKRADEAVAAHDAILKAMRP